MTHQLAVAINPQDKKIFSHGCHAVNLNSIKGVSNVYIFQISITTHNFRTIN
jgi:hypothetical protein